MKKKRGRPTKDDLKLRRATELADHCQRVSKDLGVKEASVAKAINNFLKRLLRVERDEDAVWNSAMNRAHTYSSKPENFQKDFGKDLGLTKKDLDL